MTIVNTDFLSFGSGVYTDHCNHQLSLLSLIFLMSLFLRSLLLTHFGETPEAENLLVQVITDFRSSFFITLTLFFVKKYRIYHIFFMTFLLVMPKYCGNKFSASGVSPKWVKSNERRKKKEERAKVDDINDINGQYYV